jgi:adenosine deaminase
MTPPRSTALLSMLALLAALDGCVKPPAAASSADAAATAAPKTAAGPEARTAQYFAALAPGGPDRLAFLHAMPKGGDLHVHLSGAVFAENWLRWAAEDGLCADLSVPKIASPPCDAAHGKPPASDLAQDATAYGKMIDGLSMRGPAPLPISGHDRFFATFARFGAKPERTGDQVAEVAARLARDNTFYVELMLSPGMGDARKLGQKLGWSDDSAALKQKLEQAGLTAIAERARKDYDAAETRERLLLHCGSAEADPGCQVTIRYLAQISRNVPREQLFAEVALGAELARIDRRVVGLNLVQPEDDLETLTNYTQQMKIVGFLTDEGRATNVSLHAGELAPGLVPPEDLRFHIRQAVEIAGAKRIGHGVDIGSEDDPLQLLAEMHDRQVLVEINLTSNDVILGVSGSAHPLPLYRRYDVPWALSTDDAGVSRIDLTHEYQRAAGDFGLTYQDLKRSAENAIRFSFLAGKRLGEDSACTAEIGADEPSAAACRDFLAANDKASAEFRLAATFRKFEATDWPPR